MRTKKDSVEARRARKEQRLAFETLAYAGALRASDVPLWYFYRILSDVLRSYGGAVPRKSSRRRSPKYDVVTDWDFDDIAARARQRLKVTRLTPELIAVLRTFVRQQNERITKRLKAQQRILRADERTMAICDGLKRLGRLALERCAYAADFKAIGSSTMVYAIDAASWDRYSEFNLYVESDTQYRGLILQSGQIALRLRHAVVLSPRWFRSVWRRGVAVVDRQFVLDAMPAKGKPTRVRVARKLLGFTAVTEWRELEEIDGVVRLGRVAPPVGGSQ